MPYPPLKGHLFFLLEWQLNFNLGFGGGEASDHSLQGEGSESALYSEEESEGLWTVSEPRLFGGGSTGAGFSFPFSRCSSGSDLEPPPCICKTVWGGWQWVGN